MTIEFVEAPPSKGGSRAPLAGDPVMREFAKALRANPGRWAKWPRILTRQQACSVSHRINAGRKPGTPALFLPGSEGSFQSTARDGVVYIRFVKGDIRTGNRRTR
jgi:hypothetical protein